MRCIYLWFLFLFLVFNYMRMLRCAVHVRQVLLLYVGEIEGLVSGTKDRGEGSTPSTSSGVASPLNSMVKSR